MSDERAIVLYIEDNQGNLDLVDRLLRATGRYRFIGVNDGEAGLVAVERFRPALVLADLDVPGVNGFEIARRIKSSSDPAIARIPVVAVSANVMRNERQAALDAGCVAFIEKPFEIQAFRDAVARILKEAGR